MKSFTYERMQRVLQSASQAIDHAEYIWPCRTQKLTLPFTIANKKSSLVPHSGRIAKKQQRPMALLTRIFRVLDFFGKSYAAFLASAVCGIPGCLILGLNSLADNFSHVHSYSLRMERFTLYLVNTLCLSEITLQVPRLFSSCVLLSTGEKYTKQESTRLI